MTSLSQLSRLAAAKGRRLYVPENGRKPVIVDPWFTIVRRTKLAVKLRHILYGERTFDVDSRRLDTWAWTVREFVRLRDFRYSDLLVEARRFVKDHGYVEPEQDPAEYLDQDLDLLKAFESCLRARREELQTWRNREDMDAWTRGIIEAELKSLRLLGLCIICGDDAPCVPCQEPLYGLDGRGGITPVTFPEKQSS